MFFQVKHILFPINRKIVFNCVPLRIFSATFSSFKNVVYEQALYHWDNVALKDYKGEFTYGHLFEKSSLLSRRIKETIGDIPQQRIVSLLPNDISYIVTQWATWKSMNIAVPLHSNLPFSQLKYFLEDSDASLIVTNNENADKINASEKQKILILDDQFLESKMEMTLKDATAEKRRPIKKTSNALIIYTSGTTGPPKGVVLNHKNLYHQIDCQLQAWGWSRTDVILHTLPLHHVHGIVNALLCPLYCGAKVVMLPKFSASDVWMHFLNSKPGMFYINVFMGVPTMYAKLLEEHRKNLSKSQLSRVYIKEYCSQNIRLMVSGSAPLPVHILKEWQYITGHTLLERYGMTEIGMALTNPLKGNRIPGFVGTPFPGVRVCIAEISPRKDSYKVICQGDEQGTKIAPGQEGEVGELLVKSPSTFLEYWGKKDATREAFTPDGWFFTGDTACYSDGNYKILGRTSVDIIKNGGFKISALDVERYLLEHPSISDAAVVGIPNDIWGEKVAAVIVWEGEEEFQFNEFNSWAKNHMSHYQVPSVIKLAEGQIPRNAMGKVNKKQLALDFFSV